MLLGALLIATALLLRRWLAAAPDGIRHGFTAQRLSAKDKQWMSLGSAALGLIAPQAVTPSPQPASPDVHFGGGDLRRRRRFLRFLMERQTMSATNPVTTNATAQIRSRLNHDRRSIASPNF